MAIPAGANTLPLLDFGPDFERGVLATEPPAVLDAGGYPTVGLVGAALAVVPLVVTTRHRMVAGTA